MPVAWDLYLWDFLGTEYTDMTTVPDVQVPGHADTRRFRDLSSVGGFRRRKVLGEICAGVLSSLQHLTVQVRK